MGETAPLLLTRIDGYVRRNPPGKWPAHIAISNDLIAYAAAGNVSWCMSAGDGMVRFTVSSGESAVYGVVHAGDLASDVTITAEVGLETFSGSEHYDLLAMFDASGNELRAVERVPVAAGRL